MSVLRVRLHNNFLIHTRLTAFCPGLPRWAGTRKVKPIWILLKQDTVSGSGISWAICKSAPCSRQITTPAPHHSVFYRPGALPAAQSTVSKNWRHNNNNDSSTDWTGTCLQCRVDDTDSWWSADQSAQHTRRRADKCQPHTDSLHAPDRIATTIQFTAWPYQPFIIKSEAAGLLLCQQTE